MTHGPIARLRYRRLLRRLAGPRLLRAFAEAYPDATFVEVGSNDGDQHDHLRPHILAREWRGVMVEPVPYVFERLRANYGEMDRVALENAAVSEADGSATIYHLAEASPEERAALPGWYDAIGSFSREAVLAHAHEIPDIEARLVASEVPALSFSTLLARHDLGHLDLLLVDTEGHDWEILRTAGLDALRPRLVVYEHFHLEPGVRAEARARFDALGYLTLEEGFDTFCLDVEPRDRLSETARSLSPAVPGLSAHDA